MCKEFLRILKGHGVEGLQCTFDLMGVVCHDQDAIDFDNAQNGVIVAFGKQQGIFTVYQCDSGL